MISGQFKNVDGKIFTIYIKKKNDNTNLVIGENDIFFSDNPISIETSIDDTFQPIIKKSLKLSLLSKNYLGDYFFGANEREVQINVMDEDNNCLFAGFVTPNVYTQPYANYLDRIDIECIDYLSILQYDYLTDNSNYATVKANSDVRTFKDYLITLFNTNLDVNSNYTSKLYFDRSKKYSIDNIFEECAVSDSIFLGESEDDIVTNEEILMEIMQFLNLHIIQIGFDFYIFDWNTIRKKDSISWLNVMTNESINKTISLINIDKDDYADDGTNISIADVYNQIQVKDEIMSVEDIITSPLDSDNLTSLYKSEQPYLEEFISLHADTFLAMVQDKTEYNKEETMKYKWYMQVMDNPNWKVYLDNGQTQLNTIYEQDSNGVYINQDKVARYIFQHKLTPSILRFSSVKFEWDAEDNSLINKKDTNDYLVISVNGNESDTEGQQSPTDTDLLNHNGMIEYVSNNGGMIFSPVDEKATNYLVFNGKLLLQPCINESAGGQKEGIESPKTNNYEAYRHFDGIPNFIKRVMTDYDKQSDIYYTRKFFKSEYPTTEDVSTYYSDNIGSLQPWTEIRPKHQLEYNYTYVGESLESLDQFSKLPILECELIIGDKRLVEINMDEFGNSDFVWVDKNSGVTQTYVDENGQTQSYLKTTFSLGVNPKLHDKIIGDDFELQNTIDYKMNIDAEGTAIPIKYSDHLSGKVTFRILGPVNLVWNDITRRHPSFWRHTKITNTSKFVLAHTQNIFIKDFECKIYSDNAGLNSNGDDNDLIYMSDEVANNIKKKDDITFKINTALKADEALSLGIEPSVNLSTLVSGIDKSPLFNITNIVNGDSAKAEELYCNDYFNEYQKPKMILETDIYNTDKVSNWNRYQVNYFNKTFYPISISENLFYNTAHLILKEI